MKNMFTDAPAGLLGPQHWLAATDETAHAFGSHRASLCTDHGEEAAFTTPHHIMTIRYAYQKGEASFDGGPLAPFAAQPFTLLMHPKGTPIRCTMADHPSEFVVVTFDDQVFEDQVSRVGEAALASRANTVVYHPEIEFIALALRRQIISGDQSAPLFREMLPNLMMAIALDGATTRVAREHALSDTEIDQALDYIAGHLGDSLTVQSLADELGLNATRVSKAFRGSIGQSPYQYILSRRLDAARDMLSVRSNDLAAIASACGFSSQAHMTTSFSKNFGVPPGRYRRNLSR